MNIKQRYVLIAVAFIVLAMLTYPPFYQDVSTGGAATTYTRYQCIFAGHTLNGRVDVWALLMQWLAVMFVGLIAYALVADRK